MLSQIVECHAIRTVPLRRCWFGKWVPVVIEDVVLSIVRDVSPCIRKILLNIYFEELPDMVVQIGVPCSQGSHDTRRGDARLFGQLPQCRISTGFADLDGSLYQLNALGWMTEHQELRTLRTISQHDGACLRWRLAFPPCRLSLDPLNTVRLTLGISFTVMRVKGGKAEFHRFVFKRVLTVRAEEVAEVYMSCDLRRLRIECMNVVRTKSVVIVAPIIPSASDPELTHHFIAKGMHDVVVRIERNNTVHDKKDVDNGLCTDIRHRRAAHVVHVDDHVRQHRAKSTLLFRKLMFPLRIVRDQKNAFHD